MENEVKNLGLMNGWKENPVELTECRAKGHMPEVVRSATWRCYSYYSCPICKIQYEVDSSD